MTKCCRVLCERLHIWADENTFPGSWFVWWTTEIWTKHKAKELKNKTCPRALASALRDLLFPAQHLNFHDFWDRGKSSMSELFLNTLIAGRYPEMPSFGLGLATYNKGKYWWLSPSLWPNTWKETTSGRFESRVHHSRGVPVDRQTGCSYGYRGIRTLVHTPADQGTENKVFSCASGFLFLSCLQSPFGSWDIATHM